VRFSASSKGKGSSKALQTTSFLEKANVKNFLQKVEGGGGGLFYGIFSLRYRMFWPFLCMRSSKTPHTIQINFPKQT
jgi:hypothetical protein